MTLDRYLLKRSQQVIFKVFVLAAFGPLIVVAAACQNASTGDAQPTTPADPVSTESSPTPEIIAATSSPGSSDIVRPTATTAIAPTPTEAAQPTATAVPPTATVAPSPTAIATNVPEPTFIPAPPEPVIPTPPDRDLQELGKRLVPGYIEPSVTTVADPMTVGQQVDFWVSRDNGSVIVSGEVSYIIEEVATKFETDVWPAVTDVFGPPVMPGIDGDDRMVVYTSILRSGVAGYFSAADSYPSEIRPHSNQREALYMSANRLNLTGSEYLSVIAHELQHATHFATDSSEDSWVNEGLSEVAAEIAGFTRSAASQFVRAPETSLTAWAQNISISIVNYGAANLFFAYVASHYGGNDMLAAIALDQKDGIESIDSALSDRGFEVDANEVYADWLIANYLHEESGPYSYDERSFPPVKSIYKRAPDSISGEVRSFGANYFVTSSSSSQMTIDFVGEAATSLLTAAPHSGETCWWSNHGDSIDSTLTRSVDLRSIAEGDPATLKYWVNYDIEQFWDYAYTMISPDDGDSWVILDTARGHSLNPNGNSYGAGITGRSLGWVQDSVDLSDYAGQEILLRLEYITDDAVFSKGACFDDFEIPELDWSDDTSSAGDWISEGFAMVEETIPTQYLVQVIHEKETGDPIVYQLPVDVEAKGSLTVEGVGDDDLVIIVVSAVTRQSTLPTSYTVDITP
jgi:immune inhibitor A